MNEIEYQKNLLDRAVEINELRNALNKISAYTQPTGMQGGSIVNEIATKALSSTPSTSDKLEAVREAYEEIIEANKAYEDDPSIWPRGYRVAADVLRTAFGPLLNDGEETR